VSVLGEIGGRLDAIVGEANPALELILIVFVIALRFEYPLPWPAELLPVLYGLMH
jgi:hypothetical protein